MVSDFETFKGMIEDMLEYARALPEKWQRSVRRAILDSRCKGLPLEEVAPDLDLDASSAQAEEMGLKSLGPGPFDLEKVDPRLRDLLIAHELATRLLGTLEDADAELPPEQVTELERLVAEGLPND